MADIHNLTTWQWLRIVLLTILYALRKFTLNIWNKIIPYSIWTFGSHLRKEHSTHSIIKRNIFVFLRKYMFAAW